MQQGMSSVQYIDRFWLTEAVKAIESDELVRQEAMKLGISVSDEEVDKELKSYNPPLSEDYRDVVRDGIAG